MSSIQTLNNLNSCECCIVQILNVIFQNGIWAQNVSWIWKTIRLFCFPSRIRKSFPFLLCANCCQDISQVLFNSVKKKNQRKIFHLIKGSQQNGCLVFIVQYRSFISSKFYSHFFVYVLEYNMLLI